MALAFLEHPGEALPGLGCRVLATELALAVAPAPLRDDRGHALIYPARVDGHRGAEAAADQRHALGVYVRPAGHVAHSVAGVGYLVQADDPGPLPLAVAAAAEVEAHGHIAPLGELL